MYLLLIAATSLFCGATLAVDIPVDADGLLVLNNVIYDDAIRQYDYVCVLFYTAGGETSQEMLQNYTSAATKLKTNPLVEVKMAKINADILANNVIARRYMIENFPRVHLFRKDPYEAHCTFTGEKTADEIVRWVHEVMSPPIKVNKRCCCFGGNLPRD